MITANVVPQRLKGSEGIALKQGRSIVKLVTDEGEPTGAGDYWAAQTGRVSPEGGFMQQAATRHGNIDAIRLRDCPRCVTRRVDECTAEYKLTRLDTTYS